MMARKTLRWFYDNTPPADDQEKPEFTQTQLNAHIAEEKKKYVKQLDDLKNAKGTTDAQKADLEKQINELKKSYQSKEEGLVEQHQGQIKDLSTKLEASNTDSVRWKNSYAAETFRNRALIAAGAADAFNPALVVNLLQPNMELIETIDSEGKPTGVFEPIVKMTVTKDGKTKDVKVKPEEAVKILTENPKEYGSLFKNSKQSGVGGNNEGGSSNGKSLADLAKSGDKASFREQYRKDYIPGAK